MLDVVLIRLISAGLQWQASPASTGGKTDQPHDRFIKALDNSAPTATRQLIELSAERIWQACRAVGLPADIAEPHIEFLAATLTTSTATAADRALFVANASPGTQSDTDSADQAAASTAALQSLTRRLLDHRIEAISEASLDHTILTYLLEIFLTGLATERDVLLELQPHIAALLSPPPAVHPTGPSATSKPNASRTLAKIERADALGLTVPLLDTITVTLINRRRSADLRDDDLARAASEAHALDAALSGLHVGESSIDDLIDETIAAFHNGQLLECDRHLASAEERVVKQAVATSPPDAQLANGAIRIRSLRAALHAFAGDHNKSARHYGFAQRYIPRADTTRRWHYASLEAHHYERAAARNPASPCLDNAARACTSALATLAADSRTIERAEAQTTLAGVLILLGEQNHELDRFNLAAQLLDDAAALAQELDDAALQTRATALRADALTRLGEVGSDPALLEHAIELYRTAATTIDAIEVDDPEAGPAPFLQTRLALAVLAYAELLPNDELCETALKMLDAEHAALSAATAVTTEPQLADLILAKRAVTARQRPPAASHSMPLLEPRDIEQRATAEVSAA